ncbi:hypothetical protein D9611_008874 [Ephemerocybe angulata]|uniref:Uncharacterized protein n=1 Tax=Ephemerocybe angulata TaxID=980116 RepID=A0A8H5FCL1_9AGAR|nr:hypothetical protein D9611_008874 [Tulosesus angulatus]
MNVIRIMDEHDAANVTYGLDKEDIGESNVLFFVLGGGTLDESLLTIEGILRSQSRRCHEYNRKHKKDLSSNPRAVRRSLSLRACQAHPLLCLPDHHRYRLPFRGLRLLHLPNPCPFSRNPARICSEPPIKLVEKVLRNSNIDKSSVHEIALVGGSTRLSHIVKLVSDFFKGKEPNKSINPDETIDYGAVVQAVVLTVYEKRARTKDNNLLGKGDLSGIPQPSVAFLRSPIRLPASPTASPSPTTRESHLSKEVIGRMVSETEQSKPKDEKATARIASKNGLESHAYKFHNFLNDDKLSPKFDAAESPSLRPQSTQTHPMARCLSESLEDEYESKQKESESIPIMRLINSQADGAPDSLPSAGAAAPGGFSGAGGTAAHKDSPSEETD